MELLTILLSGFGDFLGTPIFDAEDFWKLITKTVFNPTLHKQIISPLYTNSLYPHFTQTVYKPTLHKQIKLQLIKQTVYITYIIQYDK